jgi:hypothetical protein
MMGKSQHLSSSLQKQPIKILKIVLGLKKTHAEVLKALGD